MKAFDPVGGRICVGSDESGGSVGSGEVPFTDIQAGKNNKPT